MVGAEDVALPPLYWVADRCAAGTAVTKRRAYGRTACLSKLARSHVVWVTNTSHIYLHMCFSNIDPRLWPMLLNPRLQVGRGRVSQVIGRGDSDIGDHMAGATGHGPVNSN